MKIRWNGRWAFYGPLHAGWVLSTNTTNGLSFWWVPCQNESDRFDVDRNKRGPFVSEQAAKESFEAELNMNIEVNGRLDACGDS